MRGYFRCRRRNKFGAIPVHDLHTGESWDSRGEHARWQTLKLLEAAGQITGLVGHPKVVLLPAIGTVREIAWHPDAAYTDTRTGVRVWEDYKPRPVTPRETLMFNLWQRHGPGPLRIVGANGRTLKEIMARAPGAA